MKLSTATHTPEQITWYETGFRAGHQAGFAAAFADRAETIDTLRAEVAECHENVAEHGAEIDRLRAENARLRAALADATSTLEAWHLGNAGHMCADPGWRVAMQDETGRQINRARATLAR